MVELLVVGGGRMGEALVGGLIADGRTASDIVVVEPDPDRRTALAEALEGIGIEERPVAASGAILAVKPELIVPVCREVGDLGIPRVLSIAAGVRLGALEAALPHGTAVVRAMPNTPSLVGRGSSAIAGGSGADDADLTWAEDLLGAVGIVRRVDEPQLDAVTGLSGSGPAYVFLLAEALVEAGVEQGLPRAVAHELAVQMLLGSAEMLHTGGDPATLRAAVTSPGGTTAAGLRALEEGRFRATVAAAVEAATARSRRLA